MIHSICGSLVVNFAPCEMRNLDRTFYIVGYLVVNFNRAKSSRTFYIVGYLVVNFNRAKSSRTFYIVGYLAVHFTSCEI